MFFAWIKLSKGVHYRLESLYMHLFFRNANYSATSDPVAVRPTGVERRTESDGSCGAVLFWI